MYSFYIQFSHKAGDGLIKYKCDNGVYSGLESIEGDYEAEKIDHHGAGDAHEIRRYEKIGRYHYKSHGQNSADKADSGAFFAFMAAIDHRRDKGEDTGCNYMHDDAVNLALGRDGKPLENGDNKSYAYSRGRAKGKAADKNGDIRRVIFQKCDLRKNRKMDKVNKNDAYCGHNCHGGELTGAGFAFHVWFSS